MVGIVVAAAATVTADALAIFTTEYTHTLYIHFSGVHIVVVIILCGTCQWKL